MSAAEMPAYRASCENCGFKSAATFGGVPMLILDEPSEDSDADPTDRRLIRLDDRRARDTMARHGYSFVSATVSGRYLRVFEVFCRDCWRLYQIRTLAPAFAQRAFVVWVVLAIPFGVLFYTLSPGTMTGIVNGLFFGSIAAGATLALIDPVSRLCLRLRYPARAREFSTPAVCPECGSKSNFIPAMLDLIQESQRYTSQLPCPNCKRKTMKIMEATTNNHEQRA